MYNDDILDEIFHEARKQLKTGKEQKPDEEDRGYNIYGSRQSLEVTANGTWRKTGDSFHFACRKIQTRSVEIENRLNKVTSADILASLKVFAINNDINPFRTKDNGQDSTKLDDTHKKVRFLVQDGDKETNLKPPDDDSVESLLEIIRHWLDPSQEIKSYPDLEEDNKILSAYWDAIRVVGQGRDNVEPTIYNNPFDPRLRFDGLAHLVSPKFDGRHVDDRPEHNVLLNLEKVSDIVDECLSEYTKFLRGLSQKSQILSCSLGETESTGTEKPAVPNDASLTKLTGSGLLDDDAANISTEEIKVIDKIKAVKGIWDECRVQVTGSQIPRRITARKPHAAPKWRATVKSEINTSAWPKNSTVDEQKQRVREAVEPRVREILRRKDKDVTGIRGEPVATGDNENGRNDATPRDWQRFAQEHIDEDALKHLKNATKERPGIKIMQPSSTRKCDTPVTHMGNTYASRVAKTVISTVSNNVCQHNSNMTTSPASQTDVSSDKVATSVSSNDFPICSVATDQNQTTDLIREYDLQMNNGITQKDESQRTNNAKPEKNTTAKTDLEDKITRATNILESSNLNPLNSSPEWLRRLIAKTMVNSLSVTKASKVGGVDLTSTVCTNALPRTTTNLAQSLKVPFVSSTTFSDSTVVTLGSEITGTVTTSSRVPRTSIRVPPGFENVPAKTEKTHPQPVQLQPTIHIPTSQWQKAAGAVYTGANGETFVQQPGYQSNATMVVQGFQRPVTQIGGNIAIWHPQPQGNYMLTDVNGKTVGVGVPAAAWSRVELQPRPHVVVHQQQMPANPHGATYRQGAMFAQTANTATIKANTYSNQQHHHPQQGQINPAESQVVSIAGTGTASNYVIEDNFLGYGSTAVQPPSHQIEFQTRVVPQFLPPVPRGPPMVQEYTLFAPNQHNQQLYSQQQNLNQNNSNLNTADVASAGGRYCRGDVRICSAKVQRAIRSNLIQLA